LLVDIEFAWDMERGGMEWMERVASDMVIGGFDIPLIFGPYFAS